MSPQQSILQMEFFLSYVHTDKQLAGKVGTAFEDSKCQAFRAHDMLKPDEEWVKEIFRHLDSCNALVAIVTSSFGQSAYANQEVGYMLRRGKPVLSFHFDGNLPGFLTWRQAIPASEANIQDAINKGISFVQEREKKTEPIQPSPFDRELADRVYVPLRKEIKGWLQNPWFAGSRLWTDLDQDATYLVNRVRKVAPDVGEMCDKSVRLFDDIYRLKGTVSNLVTQKADELVQDSQPTSFDEGSKVTFSNLRLTPEGVGDFPIYLTHAWVKQQRMADFAETLARENYPNSKT